MTSDEVQAVEVDVRRMLDRYGPVLLATVLGNMLDDPEQFVVDVTGGTVWSIQVMCFANRRDRRRATAALRAVDDVALYVMHLRPISGYRLVVTLRASAETLTRVLAVTSTLGQVGLTGQFTRGELHDVRLKAS